MASKKQQPKQKHPLLTGLAQMLHAEQFEQNVASERARQFEALGNDPFAWLECADCLLRSARAILDRPPHEPGCLMLPALMGNASRSPSRSSRRSPSAARRRTREPGALAADARRTPFLRRRV
jgi:hypothetical protein